MTEITAAYIASITEAELKAAGYIFVQEHDDWWIFTMPDHIAHDGGYFTLEEAIHAAATHYAPYRKLDEALASNERLKELLREAYEGYEYDTPFSELVAKSAKWRDEAAALLGEANHE